MWHEWTKENEDLLIECIASAIRNGRRISDGIIDAAAVLDRTPGSCEYRYYSRLRGSDDPRMDKVREAKRERLQMRIATYHKDKGLIR